MSSVKYSTWRHFVENVINILFDDEDVELMYLNAHEFALECLVDLWRYSLIGQVDIARKNPFGLQSEGSFYGLLSFKTWGDAVTEWVRRNNGLHYSYTHPDELAVNETGKLVAAVLHYDALPPPPPEPEPETIYSPRPSQLRAWYGSVAPFDAEHPVYILWLTLCRTMSLFPTLTEISDEPRGQIYHFSNGMKIICADGKAYLMTL